MFTGIVEGTGKVLKLRVSGRQATLTIQAPFTLRGEREGDSIAVNGCCLTVVRKNTRQFTADLSVETLRVTNLGHLKPGSLVNLERPIRLADRLGGHLVQGHVDAVGKVVALRRVGENDKITIQFPNRLRPYLIPKGSIAVDGVSMTVNDLTPQSFSLVVIPHTLKQTNLARWKKGQLVNLEADMIGKYVVAQIFPPLCKGRVRVG